MATYLYIVGARPNFVKMAPVVSAMTAALPASRHLVANTGQHYDPEMSTIFFEELGLHVPHHQLAIGSGSHGRQTGAALAAIERVIETEHPSVVLVPGDVNSTLAGALAAAKLGLPVAHVEAGLRSYDRSMPEEVNRVLVDHVSEWCFVHCEDAVENLRREGIPASRIHFVGNTMIDTLVSLRPQIDASDVVPRLGLRVGSYWLVTLHRPALVDGDALRGVIDALGSLSRTRPIVFPAHPRARSRIAELSAQYPDIRVVDPTGYVDFLSLELHAHGVITDSGGVQEETTYLGVPCFTLRANTERPVTVNAGTNRLLGLDPHQISALGQTPIETRRSPPPSLPGWDGEASVRLAAVFAEWEHSQR